ncbi:hypothetical protein DENIS_0475 [Desulfonema ishimotonii]|uniref:Uncharacterized protein n=1 Tax=Desulfonema ishimotonii TaxID=45657 RepID=A0A401FRF1_9BACT|nr:hypothetical protein DENIS_0475 [Desulfonema ishimotonii]
MTWADSIGGICKQRVECQFALVTRLRLVTHTARLCLACRRQSLRDRIPRQSLNAIKLGNKDRIIYEFYGRQNPPFPCGQGRHGGLPLHETRNL